AEHLSTFNLQPESIIGVYLDRSIEAIISFLAIWKIGCTYLPIDSLNPPERVQLILSDAAVSAVITSGLLSKLLKTNDFYQIVDVEQFFLCHTAQDTINHTSVSIHPKQHAYVIYTSGSTGTPKGVIVSHQSLLNLIQWHQNQYKIKPNDRASHLASLSFDASVWEIWPYLTIGASLHLPEDTTRLSPTELYQWLAKQKITRCFCPTPLAEALFNEEFPKDLKLKQLYIGGDRLRTLPEKELPYELINHYGPTENTVVATYHPVKTSCRAPLQDIGAIIGKPIDNVGAIILNEHLQRVPVGVYGELCLYGKSLAAGYLNHPNLTAGSFIANPFSSNPKDCLYRTGDLARFLRDGNIEFLGRKDHQVKVRGYRIELGEIESILKQHPAIKDSLVQISQQNPLAVTITAYLILNKNFHHHIEHLHPSSEWENIYNTLYKQSFDPNEHSFNIAGWQSSYTLEPIPANEMKIWRDSTVTYLLNFQPQHVLDIGCGTGLFLFPLTEHCRSYTGTDLSQAVIKELEQSVSSHPNLSNKVTLHCKAADDLSSFPAQSFDTVLLNSVIQYFPNIQYLVDVIKKAVDLIKDKGILFIGDVRDYRFIELFHSSVRFYQAAPETNRVQLQHLVQKSINEERELMIDPEFFTLIQAEIPRIQSVWLTLKRGHYSNELIKFRYDATLFIGRPEVKNNKQNIYELNWPAMKYSQNKVLDFIESNSPDYLIVKGVLNSRVQQDVINSRLTKENTWKTIGELKRSIVGCNKNNMGGHPEDWWKLEDHLPYHINVQPSIEGIEFFDVWFVRQGLNKIILNGRRPKPNYAFSIHKYANEPEKGIACRKLPLQLKESLSKKLPDYMLPSHFVILENWPLNTNGKIDRKSLPIADIKRKSQRKRVIPFSPIEKTIASIWFEVLKIDDIGVHENFFEVGGNSMLIAELQKRLQNVLKKEVAIVDLFKFPTINSFAQSISSIHKEELKEKTKELIQQRELGSQRLAKRRSVKRM
ncbi:MAG: amino acid adenylation domain-containing protein, partial [Desulfobacteraceae bacterium]